MRISQVLTTLAVLIPLGGSSVMAGDLHVEGAALFLRGDGTALLRHDIRLTLSERKTALASLVVPAYVRPADLHVAFPGDESSVTVLSMELAPLRADEATAADGQLLTITVDSRIRGKADLCLAYLVRGVRWSALNECRLPTAEDKGFLSSSLSIVNQSQVSFDYTRVFHPGSSPWGSPEFAGNDRPLSSEFPARPALPRPRPVPAPPAGADARLPMHEKPMSELPDVVSLGAGMTKSVTLGKWPIDSVSTYTEVKTVFSGLAPATGTCLTGRDIWSKVRTSASMVVKVVPAGNEPVRLPPGAVRLSYFGESSLAYMKAARWDHEGKAILLSCASSELRCRRAQQAFAQAYPDHVCTETIAVEMANPADGLHDVRILEPLFRARSFRILAADVPYNIADDGGIEFQLTLQPRETTTLSYQVRYAAP